MDEGVALLDLLLLHPVLGRESLDLARDAGGIVRRVETGDRPDAALAGEKRLPGRLRADAERRNETDSRDDDASPLVEG
jgi:hypothetical protein